MAPRDGGAVRGGKLTVRVRVGPQAGRLRATLGGRPVRMRVERRSGGRLRVATLRAGAHRDGLRWGANVLRIRVRGPGGEQAFATARFEVLRRGHGLLSAVRAARREAGKARVRVRLRRRGVTVRASLNGRAVGAVGPGGARRRELVLSADEGLRYGANHLRLVAVDRSHDRYDVARRRITILRTKPIPGAGPRRRGTVGRRVVLRSSSRAIGRRADLRYRWRWAQRPRGSHARLRRAGSRRPRFRPDVPGRYRVRLTVSERRAPARSGRRTQRRVAFTGGARGGRTPRTPAGAHRAPLANAAGGARGRLVSAQDTAIIPVIPPTPPIGVPIDTLAGPYGDVAVQVGERRFEPPTPGAGLQVVVLDRETLQLVSNSSYSADATGTAQLLAAVGKLDDGVLVAISTPFLGLTPLSPGPTLDNLNKALQEIGAAGVLEPADDPQSPIPCVPAPSPGTACSGFSAIGIPGLPAGQGTVNSGLGSSTAGGGANAGAVRGYLQLDPQQSYTFVDGDYVPYSTQSVSAGGRGCAVVSVAGEEYDSCQQDSTGVDAGAYVVILDAGTLELVQSRVFDLGPSLSAAALAANLQAMYEFLHSTADDPVLVFTQSIGPLARPGGGAAAQWWDEVAAMEQHYGGHWAFFEALGGDTIPGQANPSSGYARVGIPVDQSYPTPYGKVASEAATGADGELAGTLARNGESYFYPQTAGTSQALRGQLGALAYSTPVAWPMRDTPGRRAAIRCIRLKLGLPGPIQSNYWDNRNVNWPGLESELSAISLGDLPGISGCDAKAVSAADLADVESQLQTEFTDVGTVWNLIDNLEKPFEQSGSIDTQFVDNAANEVRSNLTLPDPTVKRSLDWEAIVGDVLLMVGAVPGLEELSVLGIVADGLSLAGELDTTRSGAKPLKDPIPSRADTLALDLAESYQEAIGQFGQIGQLLVSDWGRLSTASTRALGEWRWTTNDTQAAVAALGAAARRTAYEQLFPLGYGGLIITTRCAGSGVPYYGPCQGDDVIPTYAGDYACHVSQGAPFHPFNGIPSVRGFLTVVTSASGPRRQNWIFSTAPWIIGDVVPPAFSPGGSYAPEYPSSSLMDTMFHADADGLDQPLLQPLTFALDTYSDVKHLWLRHVINGVADYSACYATRTEPPS